MTDIVEFKKWCNYNRDAKLDEVIGNIFATFDALAAEIAAMKQQEPVATSRSDGYKLVPIEPTPSMITAALEASDMLNVRRVMACYDAMLAAAPEAKP